MRVIAIANQKGGVGKTTTTVALAGLISAEGHRVLLLDMDPHGSLTTYFRQDPDARPLSLYNLFLERDELSDERIKRLIHTTEFPNIHLLPATTALATLERQAIGQQGMGLVVGRALAKIHHHYDYVLIDTPPILGVLLINALAACHSLIVPVQTEFLALKGLERMVNTLSMMSRSRPKKLSYTILPVMYDRRTQASVTTLRTLRNTYPKYIWPGHIPIDTRFRDASREGVPPNLYDSKSRGVAAYTSLWSWLKQHLIEQEQVAAGLAPAIYQSGVQS